MLAQAGLTGTSHLIFAAAFGTLPSSVTYWTHSGTGNTALVAVVHQ